MISPLFPCHCCVPLHVLHSMESLSNRVSHTHKHIHLHLHTHIHIDMHIHIHVHTDIYVQKRCIYTYMHMHIRIRIRMHISEMCASMGGRNPARACAHDLQPFDGELQAQVHDALRAGPPQIPPCSRVSMRKCGSRAIFIAFASSERHGGVGQQRRVQAPCRCPARPTFVEFSWKVEIGLTGFLAAQVGRRGGGGLGRQILVGVGLATRKGLGRGAGPGQRAEDASH